MARHFLGVLRHHRDSKDKDFFYEQKQSGTAVLPILFKHLLTKPPLKQLHCFNWKDLQEEVLTEAET